MQDFKVRRPRPKRLFQRRKLRKSGSSGNLERSSSRAALPRQSRPPRHRIGNILLGALALARPLLRPGRIPAALWFFAGMLWLGGGTSWAVLSAWNVPLGDLKITGQQKLNAVQIAAAAGLYPGVPVGGLDPLSIAERLLAHPRIARADVRRMLPGRLEIRIAERQPAALALRDDGTAAVLDREGVVLESAPAAEALHSSLPRIRGGGGEVSAGRRIGEGPLRRGLAFAQLAKGIPELAAEPITVDARDTQEIRLSLDARGRMLILPGKGPDRALRAYLAVEPALVAAAPDFRTADARAFPREGVAWIALTR